MNKKSILVAIIKKKREGEKISQATMAQRLGVNRRTYQRMEEGSMPVWVLEEVCEELGLRTVVLDKEVLK